MPQTIKAQLSGLIISTFQFENQKNKKVFNYLLLFVIFCFGLVLWLKFLNYGVIPTDRLDWLHVTFPRLTAIKQSLLTLQFPLHLADPIGINGITDRFLVIPDLIFSPDILLMRFISISDFIQIHVLICYGIGYLGLLQIKKHFKLSFTAFFLLFMVFNFNGFIVSHIAVGHLTWGAYFVLPFFLMLILDYSKTQSIDWKWVSRFVFLQFVIYLLGGYHFFVWILMFVFFLMLISPGNRKLLFFAMLFSGLINSYRILPSALLDLNLSFDFHTSFASSLSVLKSIIFPIQLQDAIVSRDVLEFAILETNFYIGLAGFLFLALMGVLFFRNPNNSWFSPLLIPVGVMIFMSIGYFYKPVFESGLPILSGERVFTRFLSLPILVLLMVSTIQFQAVLDKNLGKPIHLVYFWLINLIVANDLTQHASLWSLDKIIALFPPEVTQTSFSIQNHKDPAYIAMIWIGILLSTITFLTLIFIVKKSQIKTKST